MKAMDFRISMRLAASAIALGAVSSCAPISRESCINDSAYDIGYRAAMDNADRATRLRDIDRICTKVGREVDQDGYSDGFEAGTASFCVPDNGYRWGLKGRAYNGICSDPEFGMAYAEGQRIHRIETRRTAIRNRLEEIRTRLTGIASQLDEDEALTDERKRALLRQQDQLLLERRDLLAEQQGLPPT